MRTTLILAMPFFATMSAAHGKRDAAAIRNILQEEAAAWNQGDAQAYSQHFAADGTFTNILGLFVTGAPGGTALRQDVASLRFVGPETAVAETLTWVSGLSASGPPPGAFWYAKGRLRTRLLQVMVKEAVIGRFAAYHNVDVKPGVIGPEPQ